MVTWRALTAALALCLIALGGRAEAAGRVALVIGNGMYRHAPPLPNPANDARAIAGALRGLGFEVIEGVDLDGAGMRGKLGELAARLEAAETGLFFYAGHGLQVHGRNYLVPVDATLVREADLYVHLVNLDDVVRIMDAAVPTRLVLLDACRDNPLARSLARAMGATRSAAIGQGLAKIDAAVGTLIAYATAPDAVAYDGDGANSPFTTALLEHIAVPGLEVRQVLTRVRSTVVAATDGRQVPWDSSSLMGDFYFKRDVAPAQPPEPAPAPMPAFDARQMELALWQAARELGTPRAYEDYKARFCPDGTFCGLADLALEGLRPTAPSRPAEQEPPVPVPDEPVVAALPAPEPVPRPSFDCSQARTPQEIAICRVPEVAAADFAMGQLYRDIRARLGEAQRAELRRQQVSWINGRDRACAAEHRDLDDARKLRDLADCLRREIAKRQQELRAARF